MADKPHRSRSVQEMRSGLLHLPFFFGVLVDSVSPFSKLGAGAAVVLSFFGFLISLFDFCWLFAIAWLLKSKADSRGLQP